MLLESLKTARQKYLDTGEVSEEILNYFADNDPSKSYKYTEWMVEQFVENKDIGPEVVSALIQEFDVAINKNKIKNKDVNAYDLESMLDVVQESSQEKTKSEEKKEIKANEAEVVFENDNYLVVVPKTYEASCLYGKGTKWCTSATSTDQHWEGYTEKGVKFYYILNKNRDMDDPMYKIAVAVYPRIVFTSNETISFNNYKMEVFDAKDISRAKSIIPNEIPKNIFHNIIYLDNTTKEDIQQICEYYGIKTYTIYDDLTVDVEGDVSLARRGLSHIPLNFGVVSGSFYCSDNNLTSLEGAPQKVWRWFDCSDNNLTSLEGAPQEVGGSVRCSRNNLTTLQGAPRKVGRDFYCADNNLTTLEGAPQKVGGEFSCRDNNLTTLEGAPQKVGGNFYCYNNNLTQEDIEWLKDNCEIGGKIITEHFGDY